MGTWSCRTDASRGHVEARLYVSVEDGVALLGRWVDDGDQTWAVELRP